MKQSSFFFSLMTEANRRHMLDRLPYFSDGTPLVPYICKIHISVFVLSLSVLIRRWLRSWIIHVSMPSFMSLCSQRQTAFSWTWRESTALMTSKEWWTSSKRGKTGWRVVTDSWAVAVSHIKQSIDYLVVCAIYSMCMHATSPSCI